MTTPTTRPASCRPFSRASLLARLRRPARLALLVTGAVAVLASTALVACTHGKAAVKAPPPIRGGVVGALFVDRNHDGKHQPGEPPLANWTVGIYGASSVALQETKTDGQGRFRLSHVQGLADETATLKYPPSVDVGGAFDESTSALHQHVEVRLGDSLLVPVDEYAPCDQAARCDLQLPDLVPVLSLGPTEDPEYPSTKQWYLDTTEQPGHVLLRFASMTSNAGPGLLHVVAQDPPSTADTQPVEQRIYGDHTVLVRRAGNFVFHPKHEHFHLERFETYELRPVGRPNAVATGSKVSFCLTDNAAVATRPTPPRAALSLDLPPMSCGTREQGISPGFTDYYGPLLADQWVDVTDVPSGDYELVLTSDPDDVLVESDETNNSVTLRLHYTNPRS